MAIDWLNTKEVDALADRLAKEIIHRIPAATLNEAGKKAESKKDRTREIVMREAQEFARSHRLNVYKKAKLANRFKWTLIEAGYPSTYVDDIAFELATVMAKEKEKEKGN